MPIDSAKVSIAGGLQLLICIVISASDTYKLYFLDRFEIESDIGKIMAITEGRASLPCNITPPIQDDNVTLVLWYKGKSEKPIYGFDARFEEDSQPEHFVQQSLEERARFHWTRSPALLDINRVKESDAGAYRCRVDFFKSRTVHYKVTLVVTVPPRKPIIMDENGQSMKGTVGPFNEGSRLHLICEVEGGKPKPVVKWWRGANLISSKSEIGRGGVIRSELIIPNLLRSELDAKYTCEATNNNVTQPPATDIILDMNFKPKIVRITTAKEPLSAGKKRKLVCESSGSRPPAVMTWWKGSKKMKKTEDLVSLDHMSTTSVLIFTPTSMDSGSYLSCRADNPTIPESALEDGWKLKVYYKPELMLKIDKRQSSSESNIEGSDVYLLCSISADPWITQIEWFQNGKRLDQITPKTILTNDATLHLESVGRENRGKYQCTAKNEEGEGKSNVVELKIKHKPFCKSNLKRVYIVSELEAAKILCEVESDPDVTSFRWTFNNSAGEREIDSYTVMERRKSIATFMPRNNGDHGSLNCWAKNEIGEQAQPCLFNLVFAGPPEQVKNCSIVNQTNSMLHVKCIPGSNGGLPQMFVVEVYDMTAHKSQANITTNKPYFLIQGLEAEHTFTIIITAANVKGRSHSYQMVARTSQHPLKHTGSQDGSTEYTSLPVLVVVVVILVIIALIIILIMKKRQGRQRQKSKEKKSQSPEIQRTQNHLLGTTIDQDFQQYDVKGPDIIPARGSAKESGFVELDDRLVKRFNNIRDVLYENEVYDKDNPEGKISCISDSSKSLGEVHYAELSLPSKRNQRTLPLTSRAPHIATEYATIDFKKSAPDNVKNSGIMLKPPSENVEEDANVTAETPLMFNQRESSV